MNSETGVAADRLSLDEINRQLERRLWGSVIVMVAVLTPLSMLRALNTGWLPLYTAHAVIFVVMTVVHLFRRRTPHGARLIIALLYMQTVAVLSLFTLGLVGFGCLWLVVISYLVGVLYGFRAGMMAVAANLLLVIVVAVRFKSGIATLPLDPDAYMRTTMAWVLALFMMAMLPWMLLNSIGLHRQAIMQLVQEKEQQRREIEYLAKHDPLTGLVHLGEAHDRLQAAIDDARRSGRKIAVMFIDLDGFKQVNDRFGHRAGDHVLRTVGQVLKAAVREGDTVARMGGDEFMVVLDKVDGPEAVAVVAQRMLEDVRRPIVFEEATLQVGASVGIALFPEHGADVSGLQQAADVAMYEVKWAGKNAFAFSSAAGMPPSPEKTDMLRATAQLRHLQRTLG